MNPALTELSTDVVCRLVLAVLMGGAIGLNRNVRGKPAGLRTHALVALGAAVAVLIAKLAVPAGGDALSRVLQGLLTGIGFLGAGVILHSVDGKHVHGLTTAAAVWMAALLGAACGAGFYALALTSFALVALVLMGGGRLEKFIHRRLMPPPASTDSENAP